MLLNPAIIALLFVSLTGTGMVLLASGFALQVVRSWDITSGHEQQLRLERRTYLISTLLTFCFGAELAALLLFIMTAESLSGQFVGAMCATGVLNVNIFGWPVLFAKILIFFAGTTWLVINQLDNQVPDYPLIRFKYGFLLAMVPLFILETLLLFLYFLGLDPDIITSCCGSLFTAEAQGVAAEVSAISPRLALELFAACGALILATGLYQQKSGRGGMLFALLAVVGFFVSLMAIISAISLYIYELPHHHCPFCILKAEYGYIGYLLYIPLFTATAAALGSGAMLPASRLPSLRHIAPRRVGVLIRFSLVMFLFFYALVAIVITKSHLVLSGTA